MSGDLGEAAEKERLSYKPLSCDRQASVPAESVEKQGKTGRGGTLPITEQAFAVLLRQLQNGRLCHLTVTTDDEGTLQN